MEKELNKKLADFCSKLSGRHALNYACSVEIFVGCCSEGEPVENIIKSIMGSNAVAKNINLSTLNDVIDELDAGLTYSGDESSYPNKHFYRSSEYEEERQEIQKQIALLFAECEEILSFWFKQGHPFYPVFWNFAFFLKKAEVAYVFVGCGSD